MLAPSIGVSLYTWTTIIGVVLAGISLGNYLGGRLADRYPRRATLGGILAASGLMTLSILILIQFVPGLPVWSGTPLVARIVFITTVIFFIPSTIMGMVSPVVVKLTLSDLAKTGNVVGKIYACGAMGSIFGTFLTGFVLIAWMGTRMIVLLVGIVLILMAISFGDVLRARRLGMAMLVLALGLLVIGALWACAICRRRVRRARSPGCRSW